MQERLIGRYAVNDVIDPNTNELIVDNDTMITEAIADKIIVQWEEMKPMYKKSVYLGGIF